MEGIINLLATVTITVLLTVDGAVGAEKCNGIPEHSRFNCASGQCTWKEFRCDTIKHCDDNSDEINCFKVECSRKEFRCESGQCIRAEGKCNGISECSDRSDEMNCPRAVCSANGFDCPPGNCPITVSACKYRCGFYNDEIASSNFSCGPSKHGEWVSSTRSDYCEHKEYCTQPEIQCVIGKDCKSIGYNYKAHICSSVATCGYKCDSDGHCKSINNKCHFLYKCTKNAKPQLIPSVNYSASVYSYSLSPAWTLKNDNIQGYPPLFLHTNLKNLTVSKIYGEDMELVCHVTGWPTPFITWTWENKGQFKWPFKFSLSEGNSRLLVRHIGSEVQGKFSCKAKNPHGEIQDYISVNTSKFTTWQIVGIVSGVIASVLVVGAILFVLYQRRQRSGYVAS